MIDNDARWKRNGVEVMDVSRDTVVVRGPADRGYMNMQSGNLLR